MSRRHKCSCGCESSSGGDGGIDCGTILLILFVLWCLGLIKC